MATGCRTHAHTSGVSALTDAGLRYVSMTNIAQGQHTEAHVAWRESEKYMCMLVETEFVVEERVSRVCGAGVTEVCVRV